MAHYKAEETSGFQEIHLGFFFMGCEHEPGKTVPIVAVKERSSKMVMASVVPRKSSGTFVSKRIMAFLKEVGCEFGDIVVKSDQEAAIKAVVADVGRLCAAGGGGKFVVEHSPVGIWKTRTIQRRPIEERWDQGSLEMVKFVPWRVSADDPDMDGEFPKVVKLDEQGERHEIEKMADTVPRRAYIKQEDLDKHGYSMKCPGCLAILRGTSRQGHSEGCRNRIEEEMKDEPKVEDAKKRRAEFTKEATEMEDRNRKRTSDAPRSSGMTEGEMKKTKVEQEAKEKEEEKKRKRDDADQDVEERIRQEVQEEAGEKRKRDKDDEGDQNEELMQRVCVYQLEVNQKYEETPWDPGYFDDRTGEMLDAKLVKAAEDEEIKFMNKIKVGE